jgi:large subunit ribosomal protein L3
MPGRLGMDKRTVQGLEIIDIDTKENLIVIKGCIPGKSGNLLTVTVKN